MNFKMKPIGDNEAFCLKASTLGVWSPLGIWDPLPLHSGLSSPVITGRSPVFTTVYNKQALALVLPQPQSGQL